MCSHESPGDNKDYQKIEMEGRIEFVFKDASDHVTGLKPGR